MIDALINNELLPQLSYKFLEVTLQGQRLKAVKADADHGQFVFAFENVPQDQG